MPELHFSIEIYQPPEAVFALIADLANYGRWLAPSTTYAETVEISENPVRAGTTYRDVNTSNAMRGLVQECTPYSLIVFHQETEKPGVAITARYELAPMEGGYAAGADHDPHHGGAAAPGPTGGGGANEGGERARAPGDEGLSGKK